MTLPAKIVKLTGGKLPGIARTDFRRVLYVARGGSMTALAANPQFVWCDYLVRRDLERTGRVTTETAQDPRFGIKNPVLYTARSLMTRRAGNPVESPVPGLVLFDIGFGVQPADERDGLDACPKRPESRLRRFGWRQRPSVSAGRLRGKLGWMAFGARRRPCVVGRRHPGQNMQRQQGQRTKPCDFGALVQARILTDNTR